jgi:hypothetical protein
MLKRERGAKCPCGEADLPAPSRKNVSACCDKLTRRANHPKPVQPFMQKYFGFGQRQITGL